MTTPRSVTRASVILPPLAELGLGMARVVDSLGTPHFAGELLHCLHQASGAEHCVVYCLEPSVVRVVSAVSLDGSDYASSRAATYVERGLWRADAGFLSAYQGNASSRAHLVRVRKERLASGTSQITQKVFVFGIRRSRYGISVLRNEGHTQFSQAALKRLGALGEFVVSCCDKHLDHGGRNPSAGSPLLSVVVIEGELASWHEALTLRERQVCSRILYGMTVEGISIDLGIRPGSVVTYRKRAFLKCGIGTRHELMRRYLGARLAAG